MRGEDQEKETLMYKVKTISQQPVELCYLCAECSSSCPLANYMETPPHSMMSMIKKNLKDELFSSKSFLLCLGCHLCSARCPNDIEVGKVMKALASLYFHEKGVRRYEKAIISELYKNGFLNPLTLALKTMHVTSIIRELPLGLRILVKTGLPRASRPPREYLEKLREVLSRYSR